jgi:hypothetical protein
MFLKKLLSMPKPLLFCTYPMGVSEKWCKDYVNINKKKWNRLLLPIPFLLAERSPYND